jgi:hypothetical protein
MYPNKKTKHQNTNFISSKAKVQGRKESKYLKEIMEDEVKKLVGKEPIRRMSVIVNQYFSSSFSSEVFAI